jgi:hypothetical protein
MGGAARVAPPMPAVRTPAAEPSRSEERSEAERRVEAERGSGRPVCLNVVEQRGIEPPTSALRTPVLSAFFSTNLAICTAKLYGGSIAA